MSRKRGKSLRKKLREFARKRRVLGIGLVVIALFSLVRCQMLGRVNTAEMANPPAYSESVGKSLADNPLEQPAWTFFHPVWNHEDKWTLIATDSDDAKYPVPLVKASDIIDDPKDRIEKEFEVPTGLRDRVAFWIDIYSRYNSQIRVVHDRSNPAIIYGYIDFRPLYRTLGPSIETEVTANDFERKILKEMKNRISEAVGITRTGLVSPEEQNDIKIFFSKIGGLSFERANELMEDIRSQTGQSDMFLQALYRSMNLLPHIESVFRQKGLPVALARIPFVESSFNPRAKSKSGAVGIWQFMPETSRQMLRTTDEKIWADPLKQTVAATKLLQIFRVQLPDWGTTVTSYNSGAGRVKRLVQKYRLKRVDGLINNVPLSEDLGFAGRNFYSEFLAANLVEAYKEEIFSKLIKPSEPSVAFKGVAPFSKDSCGDL